MNISENSLDDSRKRRGSRNKMNGERDVMYPCPECGHRAFALSPLSGWFHCWACGIWGQTVEMQPAREEPVLSAPVAKEKTAPARPKTRMRISEELGEGNAGGRTLTEDYVSLDDAILDAIEDISLDKEVSGHQQQVRQYLIEQQIPLDWARRMRWGVARHAVQPKGEEKSRECTCLVYRNYVEAVCCNAKFRCVTVKTVTRMAPDGRRVAIGITDKGFAQESSFTPCAPYNIDCLHPSIAHKATTLIITEGEKDCLTLRMLGFVHVISAANGAQTDHAKSFEAFTEWLEPVQTVILCGDQDKPGRAMTDALAAYFVSKRVKVCRWDQRIYGKDITEVRQRNGDETALRLVEEAQEVVRQDIEDFRTPQAQEAVVQAARGQYDHGYAVGIGPATDRVFRLNGQGGLVIVTGVPGTGKTDFLNYLTMSLLRERGSHVCYCSFETPDKHRHAGELAQLWAGATDLSRVDDDEVRGYADFITAHVTHIRLRSERPTPEVVLRKAETVRAIHPDMEYLVIDPYLYLSLPQGRNITQTDAIRDMLTSLQDWAHLNKVWVFLVAHPRMLRKEDGSEDFEEVTYYTIAGSANWANVADFIFSLKRCRKNSCDYTEMNVLKVRDQKLCSPGQVYFRRQPCGRYDERGTEQEAMAAGGRQDVLPWPCPMTELRD